MPATKAKQRKKTSVPRSKNSSVSFVSTPVAFVLAALSGALLGFSAPGFDQWYLAWIGVVPFILLTVSSNGIKDAFVRGLLFGWAYNLVYLSWYLHLQPLNWLGYNAAEGMALSSAAWLLVSGHQALIIAVLAAVIRVLPLTGGFLPRVDEGRLCLPAPLLIPLLWVLIENKIGNAHDLLGVPWSMIEYSQYKQLPLIQAASWIGGIGIGALIVMFNTAVAGLIATVTSRLSFKSLACTTVSSAMSHTLTVALCVLGVVAWGYSRLGSPNFANETVSVVQGNINIDMEKHHHVYSLSDLAQHYERLVSRAPAGLCIWTESALPAYLKDEPTLLSDLKNFCKDGKRDMVIGALDRDYDGRPYNSALAITSSGTLVDTIYHKRYLVPFGEYMPGFAHYLPDWAQRLTNTPAGQGFSAGKIPAGLSFSDKVVAPLICFETLSPELVVASVRNGGQLLVNLSDLAWFHKSMVGDQMVAFSVFRAVETGRCFVFAANTGPSAIIDEHGSVLRRSPQDKALVLSGKIRLMNERTPFTEWFN
jgi:apolipoprotein N-acyltransferase